MDDSKPENLNAYNFRCRHSGNWYFGIVFNIWVTFDL